MAWIILTIVAVLIAIIAYVLWSVIARCPRCRSLTPPGADAYGHFTVYHCKACGNLWDVSSW
jgi:hypothetical protein